MVPSYEESSPTIVNGVAPAGRWRTQAIDQRLEVNSKNLRTNQMTTRISALLCLATLLAIPVFTQAEDKAAKKDDSPKADAPKKVKIVEVELKGGLKLKFPENWKSGKPDNSMRIAQFAIPAAKGDKEEGELVLFFGFGGGVKANIDRWIGQFQSAERKVNVKQGATETAQYFIVEITGTYNKSIGKPRNRQTKPTSGSRMLGVILGVEDKGLYFLKMTGPDKTVAAQGTALRASFGSDAKKEKEVDLDKQP
jgi:hypothetical protein